MKTKKQNKGEIIIYKNKGGKAALEVKLQKETVWLTQAQIALLFDTERSVITRHLGNIFKSGELQEKSNVQKMHIANSDKLVKFYNLDAIIAVGYRVNSKRATQFRIWATKIIKDYLLKGFIINQKRLKERGLQEFEQAIGLIKKTIENRQLNTEETDGLLKVITHYASSWLLFQKYDKGEIDVKKTTIIKYDLSYGNTKIAIDELKGNLVKKKQATEIFGIERENSFQAIIGNLYQTFGGKKLYPSIEEKAAHLLYFIIKDHPFVDGNKRIASFLFIVFLAKNRHLFNRNGERKFNNSGLVALALLVAESNPKQKDVIIKLIMNFLSN